MRHGAIAVLALALLAAAGSPLCGQSGASAAATPFVAVLRAAVRDTGIVLTWKDSPDLRGADLIYRATSEISSATLHSATLVGTVRTGTETFVDFPPDTNPYFYAVVIRDEQGKVYRTLVPFRNVTSRGVAVSSVATQQLPIPGWATTPLAAGSVSVPAATTEASPPPGWATAPLVAATTAGQGGTPAAGSAQSTPAAPAPSPQTAAAPAPAPAPKPAAAPAPAPAPAPQAPATQAPAPAPAPPSTVVPERSALLPLLDPGLATSSDQGLPTAPAPREVAAATENAIAVLMRMAAPVAQPQRTLEVLPTDSFDATGEGGLLMDIVSGPLRQGMYPEAEQQLENFLSVRRSPTVEARGRFYLGQALWFQGRIREALIEFLASGRELPRQAKPWQDACLDQLARS